MCYAQIETVAAIEVEHHLQLTCQTLAEMSAGGAWVEIIFIPDVCWGLLYPQDQRFV
jgi:hypothetical protein